MKMARRSPSCRVTCCQHLSPLLCTGVSVMHVLFYLNHLRVHYMHCDPSLLKAAAVFPEHRCILSHTHNTAVMSGSASTLVCNVPSICILVELTQQCPLAPCKDMVVSERQAGVGGACGRALYALAISHETLLI